MPIKPNWAKQQFAAHRRMLRLGSELQIAEAGTNDHCWLSVGFHIKPQMHGLTNARGT